MKWLIFLILFTACKSNPVVYFDQTYIDHKYDDKIEIAKPYKNRKYHSSNYKPSKDSIHSKTIMDHYNKMYSGKHGGEKTLLTTVFIFALIAPFLVTIIL